VPSVSAAQQRLMRAAAHTKGGYDGVPQSVGREFVDADKREAVGKASRTAKHLAFGGAAGGDDSAYGLVQSAIPGRTDRHNVDLPAGSYVIPADVVSGLGEGNTFSGAALMDKMLSTGPWGTKLPPSGNRGSTIPRPASPYSSADGSYQMHNAAAGYAKGGKSDTKSDSKDLKHHVPAVIAGGEFVIPPDVVAHHAMLGGLDPRNKDPKTYKKHLTHGHQVLDAFVKHARQANINTMKKLPGPVK